MERKIIVTINLYHVHICINCIVQAYNEISSIVSLALCIITSLVGSLPVAKSAMRGMKTKAIGAAIEIEQ